MAVPLSADRIVAALRAEGVTVVEVDGWRTHNRNHKGPWGPVNGVMIHHAGTSGSAATVRICRDGYAKLPGPLGHGVITKDGRVHLIGYGRTNHAGPGDPDVLAAVIAEKPLPPDNEATTDGNARFYGFECENLGDGEDPWPPAQLEAIERASAAICRAHGWSARSVIGHLEWQPGKPDPRGFTMAGMRARIGDRLASAPGGGQSSKEISMSVPAWVNLGRTDWAILQPETWTSIYFDSEHADETGDHVQGGSVVAKGPCQITGSVGIRARHPEDNVQLELGVQIQTALAIFNGDTFETRLGALDEAPGTPGHTWMITPVDAKLGDGKRLRIQVKHWWQHDVLVDAYLRLHVWKTEAAS